MTNEIIKILSNRLDGVIYFKWIEYSYSQKFSNKDKSLYLIFAAYNEKEDCCEKITYEPKTGYIHITLHPITL